MKNAILFFIGFITIANFSVAQYSTKEQAEIDAHNKVVKSPFASKSEKAYALNSLGFIYRFNYDYQSAIQAHEQSLEYYLKDDDKWGQALCNSYLGYVYMAKKSYKTALEYLLYSYKLFNQYAYKVDAAFVLIQIGYIYNKQHNNTKAFEYFDKAFILSTKIKDDDGIVKALSATGYMHQNLGNLPKAMEYFEQCLTINRKNNNKAGIATSLLDIAGIYFEQGNFYKQIENAEEALALYTKIDDDYGLAHSLNLIGMGYKELGELDIALKYMLRCLNQNKKLENDYGIATAYNNLATIYFLKHNLNESLKYHELGLEMNMTTGDKYGICLSTNNVGYVYFNLGNVEKGKENGLKSEKLAAEFGNPRLIRFSKRFLFEVYFQMGDMTNAEKYVLELIELNDKSITMNFPTLSESEKEKFFQNISPEFMEFNGFVLKRKTENPSLTGIVYNNTLKQKGLLLKSSTAMRHAIFGSNDTTLIRQYDDWILLKTEIAEAYTNGESTTKLEEKANILEKSLVIGSQAFSDLDKIQNLTWKDVQKNLKEQEVAVEFIHFNEFDQYGNKQETVQYAALIITPTSTNPEMISLCQESELENLLGSFGGNNLTYINGIYGTETNPNTTLYNLVWKPLEPFLRNAKTIYLAPTGLLHRVAFSAIAKEKSVLLCDFYDIRLQSSTSKIAMPEEFNLGTNWNITLFGGIDYDTDSSSKKIWLFLEGTKVEVENISEIFTKGNFKVAQSKTEEGFKENAPTSDIIHMSTHGFFYPDPEKLTTNFEIDTVESGEDLVFRGSNSSFGVKNFVFNKNPLMRSGLVLSGANRVWNNPDMKGEEDGVLTAYEVAQIDLRQTELVVLSACETGLGDINGGEGVYGLQRSFKMAGVKYIIMSLWQVPDNETQEFMTLFYKNLLLLKEPKQAFAKTQLAMRKKYDPYYWAAFVLIE